MVDHSRASRRLSIVQIRSPQTAVWMPSPDRPLACQVQVSYRSLASGRGISVCAVGITRSLFGIAGLRGSLLRGSSLHHARGAVKTLIHPCRITIEVPRFVHIRSDHAFAVLNESVPSPRGVVTTAEYQGGMHEYVRWLARRPPAALLS